MICEVTRKYIDCAGEVAKFNDIIELYDALRRAAKLYYDECKKNCYLIDMRSFDAFGSHYEYRKEIAELKCECLNRRINKPGWICKTGDNFWYWEHP